MKYLILYSGGIDSTAVLIMFEKLGLEYEIAHFIISPSVTKRAMLLLHHLDIHNRTVHVWNYRKFLRLISTKYPSLTCLICKRAMIEITNEMGVPVTGDALGQVASQTLHNLRVIGMAARPLLGSDKEDVDLFLIRALKDLRRVELVRKGSVQSCPFKPTKPLVRASKRVGQMINDIVKEHKHTIEYLGMKKISDLTALG